MKLRGKILSLLLAFILFMGSFSAFYAESDAMERVKVFLNLGAGKQQVDGVDITQLSQEELQFLGIYLSNYFVPFKTDVGIGGSEEQSELKKEMAKNLQDVLGFAEPLANQLAGIIFDMIRGSSKELKLTFQRENPLDGAEVDDSYASSLKASFASMWAVSISNKKTITEYAKIKGITDIDSIRYAVYYFINEEGKKIPVYVSDMYGEEITPSVVAFVKSVHKLGKIQGYGASVFDINTKILGLKEGESFNRNEFSTKIGGWLKGLDEESAEGYTIFGAKLRVDCFGNILYMGSNFQNIAIPAASNPYTWVPVKEDGSDYTSNKAGTVFNIANILHLSQLGEGNLFDGDTKFVGADSKLFEAVKDGDRQAIVESAKEIASDFVSNIESFLKGNTKDRLLTLEDSEKDEESGSGSVEIKENKSNINKYYKAKSNFTNLSGFNDVGQVDGLAEWSGTVSAIGNSVRLPVIKGSDDTQFSENFTFLNDKKANEILEAILRKDAFLASRFGVHDNSIIMYSLPNLANYLQSKEFKVIGNLALIDNLGVFGWNSDNGKDVDYKAINFGSVFDLSDPNNKSKFSFLESAINSMNESKAFSNHYSTFKKEDILSVNKTVFDRIAVSLYITYAYACLYDESSEGKKETIGQTGFRINKEGLPTPVKGTFQLDGEFMEDLQIKAIKDWVYYILHPTEGLDYFSTWVKNKVTAVLLDVHESIVGSKGTGVTAGSTKYKSSYGLSTIPDAKETEWMVRFNNIYTTILPWFFLLMVAFMIYYVTIGLMTPKRAIITFTVAYLVFGNIFALFNYAITSTNKLITAPLSSKFNHWAVVQHQSYSALLDSAARSNDYTGYLNKLTQANLGANQGGDPVNVKWQAPKKMAALVLNDTVISTNQSLSKMLQGVLNKGYSGESYAKDKDLVYMYRSYLDLSNVSRYLYGSIKDNIANYNKDKIENLFESEGSEQYKKAKDSLLKEYKVNEKGMALNEVKYQEAVSLGFINKNADDNPLRFKPMLGATPYIDELSRSMGKLKDIPDLEIENMPGISTKAFNFAISFYTQGKKESDRMKESFKVDSNSNSMVTLSGSNKSYGYKDIASLGIYGIMSESPYYYFSFNLYDQGLGYKPGYSGGYKRLLLGEKDSGYFYNNPINTYIKKEKNNIKQNSGDDSLNNSNDVEITTETLTTELIDREQMHSGHGEMKDYLDMRGLFTYVIPYLKMGNDLVKEWDGIYGIKIYDDAPYDEDAYIKIDKADPMNAEFRQRTWHNISVSRLYSMYTPWVDIMYDSSYAQPQVITHLGEKITIKDPLNPQSYPEGRPMVFSRSEMMYYGLKDYNLTEVEKRIIKFGENTQEKFYKLLDYYQFNDSVMNSAAAIEATFEFNKLFSDPGMFQQRTALYPQGYELADFSHDAYLRLVLSNATGEKLVDDSGEGFYQKIVKNSNIIVAIMLIINDIVGQYVLPMIKMATLICLVVLAFLMMCTFIFKMRGNPVSHLINNWLKPMLRFFGYSVVFAFILSFMMQGGTGNVANSDVTIKSGDPTISMLLLLIVMLYMSWTFLKILAEIWETIKEDGSKLLSAGFISVAGLGLSIYNKVAGGIKRGADNVGNKLTGSKGGIKDAFNTALGGKDYAADENGMSVNGQVVDKQDGKNVQETLKQTAEDIEKEKTANASTESQDNINKVESTVREGLRKSKREPVNTPASQTNANIDASKNENTEANADADADKAKLKDPKEIKKAEKEAKKAERKAKMDKLKAAIVENSKQRDAKAAIKKADKLDKIEAYKQKEADFEKRREQALFEGKGIEKDYEKDWGMAYSAKNLAGKVTDALNISKQVDGVVSAIDDKNALRTDTSVEFQKRLAEYGREVFNSDAQIRSKTNIANGINENISRIDTSLVTNDKIMAELGKQMMSKDDRKKLMLESEAHVIAERERLKLETMEREEKFASEELERNRQKANAEFEKNAFARDFFANNTSMAENLINYHRGNLHKTETPEESRQAELNIERLKRGNFTESDLELYKKLSGNKNEIEDARYDFKLNKEVQNIVENLKTENADFNMEDLSELEVQELMQTAQQNMIRKELDEKHNNDLLSDIDKLDKEIEGIYKAQQVRKEKDESERAEIIKNTISRANMNKDMKRFGKEYKQKLEAQRQLLEDAYKIQINEIKANLNKSKLADKKAGELTDEDMAWLSKHKEIKEELSTNGFISEENIKSLQNIIDTHNKKVEEMAELRKKSIKSDKDFRDSYQWENVWEKERDQIVE